MTNKEKVIKELKEVLDSLDITNKYRLNLIRAIEYLQEEPVSKDLEKIVEEIAEPTILNAYGTKELARRLRNTICGTSVNESLEEASKEWLSPQLDKSYAAYGETKQMELTHFDGYAMLDAIEFGAQWQKEKHERQFSFINLKDCKDAYNKWKGTQKEPVSAALSWVRACQWQKQQDQSTIELAEDHAMLAGMEKMKEELMANGVDGVVHHFEKCEVASVHYNDPTGVPMAYYFTSTQGLSVGDKVKVIVIKED